MKEKFQIIFEETGEIGPLHSLHVLFYRWGFGPIWQTGGPKYHFERSFDFGGRLDRKGLRLALREYYPNSIFELDKVPVCDIRAGASIYFEGYNLL